MVVLSIGVIVSTFAISVYVRDVGARSQAFVAVLAAYLIVCLVLYRVQARREPPVTQRDDSDIDTHLKILDEAKTFFAGSLKTSDTFRLVISRINGFVPFDRASLLLCDEGRENFVVAEVDRDADEKGRKFPLDSGVAGKSYVERDVVIDAATLSAAVPLKRNAEVFGVLVLGFAGQEELETVDTPILDAIGERLAPLVLASIAYERSAANALTDVTTELPNERAFHLVLENQVAESIRRGNSRPLTILSFDIKGLSEINSRHGHAAGDRVLNFVAQAAKDDLRQMDFFARGEADEFLTIMPTASKEISHEIIARIQTSLFGRKIAVSDVDAVEIELNFGWACFGADGETPAALIAVARERKEQSKSPIPGSVLWFPQEVAH
jgi:diguanylate cyclase (GGDEF)-like protein